MFYQTLPFIYGSYNMFQEISLIGVFTYILGRRFGFILGLFIIKGGGGGGMFIGGGGGIIEIFYGIILGGSEGKLLGREDNDGGGGGGGGSAGKMLLVCFVLSNIFVMLLTLFPGY